MANDFLIPKVTPAQYALIGARTAGIIAVNIATEARKNTRTSNPYDGQLDRYYTPKTIAPPVSDLSTSVFADVSFDSVNYTDNQGKKITTSVLNFQAILVSVTFPKRVVKTEIQGRDGTVKEYIGQGDAQVSFKGVITGTNGVYPTDAVTALKDMLNAPMAIPVYSEFLTNLGINSIVFENSSFEQDEGGYSYQTFALSGISDTPLELKISGL